MGSPTIMNISTTLASRRKLRNGTTSAEAVLWNELKNRKFEGLKFRRQHGIDPYVVDFYCPELRLAVELDGEVHDNSNAQKYYDARTDYLSKVAGVRVLRFENKEVFLNQNLIFVSIREYLPPRQSQATATPP